MLEPPSISMIGCPTSAAVKVAVADVKVVLPVADAVAVDAGRVAVADVGDADRGAAGVELRDFDVAHDRVVVERVGAQHRARDLVQALAVVQR